jgi:MerR family transcriptional regulator, thiopeptide resistance regulator
MAYTVKRIAEIAGVSVRTLHHYDEIGLLKPSSHSAAGYRLYQEQDLERLQQVLFFKELGFDLKEIKRVLSDPDFDRRRALVEHRKLLLERQERFGRLIQSVDRTLKAMQRGVPMNAKMFDGFDQAALEEEARQRWGQGPEWAESQKKWKSYSDADKAEMERENEAILDGLVAHLNREPDDPAVQAVIAQHHGSINRWFFTCPKDIYRQIGDGYVNDPRFTAYWDSVKPGLAVFVRDAIRVYCDSSARP